MQKHIYLAGGFFNPKQNQLVDQIETALQKNPTIGYIHSPRNHQYKNVSEDHDPEGIFGSYEWANETYNNDLTAMQLADLGVVAWDNVAPDTGTAWEMGYLTAINKPLVMVCEDNNVDTTGINLMLVKSIKAYLTKPAELAKFDFNLIETSLYKDKII